MINANANVELNNCSFIDLDSTLRSDFAIYQKGGNLTIDSSEISSKECALRLVGEETKIKDSILSSNGDNCAIYQEGGNLTIDSSEISCGGSCAVKTNKGNLIVNGGTISSRTGIYKFGAGSCKVGNVTFNDSEADICLGKGQVFDPSGYSGSKKIKVSMSGSVATDTIYQITENGTDKAMLEKVESYDKTCSIGYKDTDRYLYLWKHSHTWEYNNNNNEKNVISATCVSDSRCNFYKGLLILKLTANDVKYSGDLYKGVTIDNGISSVFGDDIKIGDTTYVGIDGTYYEETIIPPTEVGKYKAIVILKDSNDDNVLCVAEDEFAIKKIKRSNIQAKIDDYTYGGTVNEPTINVSGLEESPKITYYYNTEGNNSNGTKWAQGTVLDVGTYYMYAVVEETANYEEFTTDPVKFNIRKAKAKIIVEDKLKHIGTNDPEFTYSLKGLFDGDNIENIELTRNEGEKAGNYDITASFTKPKNYDVLVEGGKLTIEDHTKPSNPVEENTKNATCTENGYYDEVYYCTKEECQKELERIRVDTPAIGHDYKEPVFKWSKNSEGNEVAEAEIECKNDTSHRETKGCQVTIEKEMPATCTEKGERTYKAEVEFNGRTYTDTKIEEIPAKGHNYGEPVFKWNASCTSVKAILICINDKNHVEVRNSDDGEIKIESRIIKKPTGKQKGKVEYKATFVFDGKLYESVKILDISGDNNRYNNEKTFVNTTDNFNPLSYIILLATSLLSIISLSIRKSTDVDKMNRK